jgi:PD-(D/E)XK nuclease superfamily
MHHSYSGLKMFAQCPKQWHEVKLLKLHPYRETPENQFGVRAHSAMEAAVMHRAPLPPEFAAYQWVVDDILSTLSPNAEAEMPFNFAKDWTEVGPREWNRKHWNGSADLVDVVDGHAIIADWKFGKIGGYRYADTDQLACMAMFLMRKRPDVQSVSGVLVFVNDGECVPNDGSLRWTRADMPALEADWMGRTAEVEEHVRMNVFPPRPNNLCNWCPSTICEHKAPAVARQAAKAARQQR